MTNSKLFGKVVDNFFFTKFQNRGNEHVHFMLWIKDTPVYGNCTNEEIENFVDKFISFDLTLLDENLCKKYRTSNCRFNFHLPPMRRKLVLEPSTTIDNRMKDKAKELLRQLEYKHYTKETTFDNFLEDLNINEIEYIKMVQATLTK